MYFLFYFLSEHVLFNFSTNHIRVNFRVAYLFLRVQTKRLCTIFLYYLIKLLNSLSNNYILKFLKEKRYINILSKY